MERSNEMKYHGDGITKPYFEGWYFKVDSEVVSLACIVGIAKNAKEEHAFIQTIDTIRKQTQYIRFSLTEVMIKQEPFELYIGKNYFSKQKMKVAVGYLQAELILKNFIELRHTWYAPTIMGPFSYLSQMQCIHSIISLHHEAQGTIRIDKQLYDIQGIGYLEKDRGVSFPSQYIWVQSNTCEKEKTCFFLSIASIPFSWLSFSGCIAVLFVDGKQYRFTSYDGVRIKYKKDKGKEKMVHILLSQFAYHLDITIHYQAAYPLVAPQEGMMEEKVLESLDSVVKVQLTHYRKLIQKLTFIHAGCEIRI